MIVMGVSGCGKSTIGAALATALHLPFLEADGLHSEHNVAKMRAGQPLDDADRRPWLDAIAAALADTRRYPHGLVTACSALKRAYRDRLRACGARLCFVYLEVSQAEAERRLRSRPHHFMPVSLVPSQFAALQPPAPDETDTVHIRADEAPSVVEASTLRTLGVGTGGPFAVH